MESTTLRYDRGSTFQLPSVLDPSPLHQCLMCLSRRLCSSRSSGYESLAPPWKRSREACGHWTTESVLHPVPVSPTPSQSIPPRSVQVSPSQSQNSVPRSDRAGLDPACFSLAPQTLRSRETFLTFRQPTTSFNWVASDNETPSLNLLTPPLAINHPRETKVSRLRFLGSVGGP